MQAIQTRYHGPTDHNGSRITARCEAGRLVMPYDHALDLQENHTKAATLLRERLEWSGRFSCGALPDGSYAHVWCGGGR